MNYTFDETATFTYERVTTDSTKEGKRKPKKELILAPDVLLFL